MSKEHNVEGLVDAALTLLVEARRRAVLDAPSQPLALDGEAERHLGVAITACHTVLEPPSLPTDDLRAMGLWRDS